MPASASQETKNLRQVLTRILPSAEYAAIACLSIYILVKGVWFGWKNLGTDFPQYYLGAKLVAEHYSLDRFYEWAWLQRQAFHFGIHREAVGFPGLTPFSTIVLLPLAWLSALQAKQVWILLNAAALIGGVYLVSKECGLSQRRAWLIALLATLPLRNDFALGQMHLIVFVLLVLGWRYHMRGRQTASGCCIALAGALKIYPLFYCFYFLVKKRWRALGAAIATSLVCGGLSVALFGITATEIFVRRQLPRLLNGEALNPFLASTTSATTMFHRLFLFEPEWNPHPVVSSVVLYAALYALWQALPTAAIVSHLRREFVSDKRETIEWCSYLALLMFLSSQPETYHFVALIAAAVPTYAVLRERGPWLSVLYLGIYTIQCNARNFSAHGWMTPVMTIVLIPKLWAGLSLIALYIVVLRSPLLRSTTWERSTFRAISIGGVPGGVVIGGILLPALWGMGFVSSFRHWRSMAVTQADRILESDGAWIRAKPQATAQGLYYVAALNAGYRVVRDGIPVYGANSDDQMDYAVSSDGVTLWVETASSTGPVIEKLIGGKVQCELQDGELPRASQDGDSLAFIREDRGRGSLWIADTRNCDTLQEPAQVTPPEMDVRALSAMSGDQFVFSAIAKGHPGLFRVSRNTRIEPVLTTNADIEAMVVSQDGESIVLSELVREHWQLVRVSLRTHTARQITYGACNATDPFLNADRSILYATDCERSMSVSTLAEIDEQ